MRLYSVWDIRGEEDYTSVLEALLAGRSLCLADLEVDPESLHPPEAMADLELGVERLGQAIRRREKIVVFGDYDVDGVTSTVLLLEFLEQVGADCDYLLPDRYADGYGIKPEGVEKALGKGADLIVTVDNGIAAFEALELARARGVEVVVIDHHSQLDRLPPALAIIDPNRRDCPYPFKGLAGVGVVFKVVQALSQGFIGGQERRQYLNRLLELVALGTVADVMPVLGENRVFIQRGLQLLDRTERPGLRQLKVVAGCANRPLTTTALGFYLGPRLNVAGRLQTADLALQLLRAKEEAQAAVLAEELDRLNARRQELQRQGLEEAEELVTAEDLERDRILVLLGERWHLGVIGLMASKLVERYNRPVAVCTACRGDGIYIGSARSIPAYDISAGVSACAGHLLAYGGHPGAAGFSMREEEFEAVRLGLIEHANARLTAQDLQPRLTVDLMLRPEDVSLQTLELLARLEPYGNGHEVPVFGARNCRVLSARTVGREGAHLKAEFQLGERRCRAIWWNQGRAADLLQPGQWLTAAFALEADTYAGMGAPTGVQLVLKDLYLQTRGVS